MSHTESSAKPSRNRILVPLDESQRAERALEAALVLARRSGASLDLVTVPPLHPLEIEGQRQHLDDPREAPALPSPEALIERSRQQARDYLDAVRQRLSGSGVAIETHLRDRRPAEAILELAAELDASMIVMATHGRGGLTRWALGSVADRLLRSADRPVLLIREPAGWPDEGPRRILLPLDGSHLAEQGLPRVVDLARELGAAISLVRVVMQYEAEGFRMRWGDQPTHVEELRERWAKDYLEQQAEALRGQGLDVHSTVLPAKNVAEALIEQARADGCDLIAMTTHGLGGFSRWAFGSVADRLIRAADLPLLLVRADEPEAADGP